MADKGKEYSYVGQRKNKKRKGTKILFPDDIFSLMRAKHHFLTYHGGTKRSTLSTHDESRFVRPPAHPPLSEGIRAQYLLPMSKWPVDLMASYDGVPEESDEEG